MLHNRMLHMNKDPRSNNPRSDVYTPPSAPAKRALERDINSNLINIRIRLPKSRIWSPD
jgi:hypothetical protein